MLGHKGFFQAQNKRQLMLADEYDQNMNAVRSKREKRGKIILFQASAIAARIDAIQQQMQQAHQQRAQMLGNSQE